MYSWLYSSNGTPRLHSDGYNDLKYAYSYDSIGRLIRTDISEREGGAYVGSTEYGYDPRGNMTSFRNEIGGRVYTQSHIYAQTTDENGEVIKGTLTNSNEGLPSRYAISSYRYADYYYDSLNRMSMRKFRVGTIDAPVFLYNIYEYNASQRNATGSQLYQTTQLKSENVAGTTYAYTYDNIGNIKEITRNGNAYHKYDYDNLGQLIRDDSAGTGGGTYIWEYDDLGNITSRKKYAYNTGDVSSATPTETINYHYSNNNNTGWNNLLVGVDSDNNGTVDENEKISYDEIGNPTTYLGATMWWKGRQLTSYRKDGVDLLFTYDASSLRGSKTVGSVKTTYQYVGDKLYYENRGNGKELYYFYDSFGNLSAISYFNGTDHKMYYTLTNSYGDVLGIYDASGKKVAAYDYDAWGNATVYKVTQDENGNNVHSAPASTDSDHISVVNPIRYRGYYYDSDLKLYYLQSRYYDSTVGRFINADNLVSDVGGDVLGNNMFAYCLNNPINSSDPSGHWIIKNAIKKVANKVSSVVRKIREKTSAINGTFQSGTTVSGAVFVEGTASASIAIDAKGNIGIAFSYGNGIGLPNGSISKFRTITNAPNINALNGESYQIGGSVDVSGVSVGAEYTTFNDIITPKQYSGICVSAGVGLPNMPFEAHGDITDTKVKSFNVYDEIESACIKIMEW